jgi:serine/threonine protein kinase
LTKPPVKIDYKEIQKLDLATMKFPPWNPPEPTDEQLLPGMHADTRQLYETGEMNRAQWQQLRDGLVTEYKAAQQSRPNNTVSTSYETYTIRKQIGQGVNGFVYQVTNSSGAEFALKLLDPRTATEEKRKRFRNELGFCERNNHKNIITVVDRGLFENAPFYVMHCYGGSLRDLIRNPIEHQKVLPVFSQILDGVEAAHLQRVIHRDLKPENILFDQASETPVIADFGIAHFEEEDLLTAVETNDRGRLANFEYAAPEQCKRGQRVDHRADIYALGLILNEMFTGAVARGTNFKTITSIAPQYSYLDELVSQMLCNNPTDRPQTVGAVKRHLK